MKLQIHVPYFLLLKIYMKESINKNQNRLILNKVETWSLVLDLKYVKESKHRFKFLIHSPRKKIFQDFLKLLGKTFTKNFHLN
jgi:hypothetical protein